MTSATRTVTSQGTTATQVLIALGSNTLSAAHIQWATQRLAHLLDTPRFSPTLWTQDIRGTNHYYMNRLAAGTTTLSVEQLQQVLKDIEAESHRTSDRVTIDLDLMQYGADRYHERDWPRPYIQQLLPTMNAE